MSRWMWYFFCFLTIHGLRNVKCRPRGGAFVGYPSSPGLWTSDAHKYATISIGVGRIETFPAVHCTVYRLLDPRAVELRGIFVGARWCSRAEIIELISDNANGLFFSCIFFLLTLLSRVENRLVTTRFVRNCDESQYTTFIAKGQQ
jgi:hypothetical protein